jgi:hypothetical protein
VIRMIESLLGTRLFARQEREKDARRLSMLFSQGAPAHYQEDSARHRRYHHYYEDLLT